MTKQAIINSIVKQFSLSRADADVLVKVALSSHQCEIDFPPEVTEEQRAHYLSAYSFALGEVEKMEGEVSQLTEMTLYKEEVSALTSISDVTSEVQKQAGDGFKVEELGLRWGRGEMSKEDLLQLICRLYSSFLKTKRIKAFLEWSIADACNMSHQLYGNREEIVDQVSSMFGIGRFTILRMCEVAKIVPVYARIPGWTHKQYAKVIQHAAALNEKNFYATMKTLARGREIELKLSNGAVVKSHAPLNEKQVEEIILKETKGSKKRRARANKAGYIYFSPLGITHSFRLDRKALSSPSVKVVDLGCRTQLRSDGEPLPLAQHDESVVGFFSSMTTGSRS